MALPRARAIETEGTASPVDAGAVPFCRQGLCDGAPCIKIYVARKTPELLGQIPATIAGHPVVIEETGAFKALER